MVTLCIFPLFIALLDSTSYTKLKHVGPVDSVNALFRRYLCLMLIGTAQSILPMLLITVFRMRQFQCHHLGTIVSTVCCSCRSVVTWDIFGPQQPAKWIVCLVVKNNTKVNVSSMLDINTIWTRMWTFLRSLFADVDVKSRHVWTQHLVTAVVCSVTGQMNGFNVRYPMSTRGDLLIQGSLTFAVSSLTL